MSAQTVATTTSAPPRPAAARPAIVSAFLALGATLIAVLVLWQPWGERDALGYADLAPHRDAAWLGALADGLAFAVVGVALGLAVCLLAPTRGAAWANTGAILTALGGIAFGAGMVSFGAFAWYATDTAAIPATSGEALMSYVEESPGHILGVQMAGFLLFTLGSLALMVALWRSRAVPRWLPIAYLVLTIGIFAVDGVALNIVQAVQMLSLTVVAGYALRARSA